MNFSCFFFSHLIGMMMIVGSMHFHLRAPPATPCHTHTCTHIDPSVFASLPSVLGPINPYAIEYGIPLHRRKPPHRRTTLRYREFIINSKRQPTEKIPFFINIIQLFFSLSHCGRILNDQIKISNTGSFGRSCCCLLFVSAV